MSKEDSFGFTHLEEDDGDDVPDIGRSRLDVDLQPHLSPYHRYEETTSGSAAWPQSGMHGIDNPAMQGDDEAVDGDIGATHSVFSKKNNHNTASENGLPEHHSQGKSDHNATHNTNTNGTHVTPQENGGHGVSQTDIQVQYSNREGKVNVMQGHVVTRPDGSRYIDTQNIPQRWSESDRPLRQRRIRFLKIFSIAACIFFFPLGIPAVYYAFMTEKKFNEGIMQGNIDTAQKYAKRSERLTIMAFIMTVVVAALVVAIIERPYYTGSDTHRGAVVG